MIEQDEQINHTNGGRINPKRLIIVAVFMLAAVAGTSAFITGGHSAHDKYPGSHSSRRY